MQLLQKGPYIGELYSSERIALSRTEIINLLYIHETNDIQFKTEWKKSM